MKLQADESVQPITTSVRQEPSSEDAVNP